MLQQQHPLCITDFPLNGSVSVRTGVINKMCNEYTVAYTHANLIPRKYANEPIDEREQSNVFTLSISISEDAKKHSFAI
jgi:hypothetical protein